MIILVFFDIIIKIVRWAAIIVQRLNEKDTKKRFNQKALLFKSQKPLRNQSRAKCTKK